MERGENIVSQPPSTRKVCFVIRNEWWGHYIATELETVPDCFITEIKSHFTEVITLGTFANTECIGSSPSPHELFDKMDPIVRLTIFLFNNVTERWLESNLMIH